MVTDWMLPCYLSLTDSPAFPVPDDQPRFHVMRIVTHLILYLRCQKKLDNTNHTSEPRSSLTSVFASENHTGVSKLPLYHYFVISSISDLKSMLFPSSSSLPSAFNRDQPWSRCQVISLGKAHTA